MIVHENMTHSECLEKGMLPYFKYTRRKHESGYAMMEVGYCLEEEGRVSEKAIVGNYQDHLWFNESNAGYVSLNIDCTLDGYFRMFRGFKWGYPTSSVSIERTT